MKRIGLRLSPCDVPKEVSITVVWLPELYDKVVLASKALINLMSSCDHKNFKVDKGARSPKELLMLF